MEFDLTDIKFSRYDLKKGLKLPNKLSQELAYLCGIIVGDGSIYQRQDKKDCVLKIVGNPKDEQELYHEVIGPYFNKTFGFMPNIRLQDTNTTYGFVVVSKGLLIFLTEKTGLIKGKKDQRLGIPEIFKDNREFLVPFIRGLFDTDGCMCFKKRYRKEPYYPVISLSSSSEKLIKEVVKELKEMGFKVVESYNRQIFDPRFKKGFNIISRLDLNGFQNLQLWIEKINFSSPKHLNKIKKYYFKENLG
ncbi:TPA: hypothetical protein HA246_02535 [Candidatus Woesearchaeota archaeon]|nr:hypothetical protein [Candidatus Woesearchaeota archaeon]